jgi:hypothetical protein
MRKELTLTYIDFNVNIYNPVYTAISFTDINNNQYIWNVTGNTKAFVKDFNQARGEKVRLSAEVDGNILKRVKLLK